MMRSFLVAVAAAWALLPFTLAARLQDRQTAEYYLQTVVPDGSYDTGSNKSGLYVYGYHTGAGLNDAVLTSNISIASKGFLNATYQQFDYGTDFPWGLNLADVVQYTGWQPVQINTGYGSAGFFTNSAGLQGSSDLDFGGWLACDWWHSSPQLFYFIGGYANLTTITTSCSAVNLQIVPV